MAEQFTAHGSMRQAEVKFQSSGDDDRRKALGLATGRVIVLEYRNDPSKNHPSAATFQKSRVARNALLHCRKSKPFDFATATAITAPNLALKGRFLGGYSLEAERVRCPRAEGYGPHPGGSGIMPAGTLVSRFRSSHDYAAPWFANFGIKGTLAMYLSSVDLVQKSA
jgi:hypothetical protein